MPWIAVLIPTTCGQSMQALSLLLNSYQNGRDSVSGSASNNMDWLAEFVLTWGLAPSSVFYFEKTHKKLSILSIVEGADVA